MISADLAKRLRLPIYGKAKTTGTASNKGQVTILGRTKPFYIYLEGITEPVRIEPHVVKDLAQHLNLGQEFLRRYEADMSFRQGGIHLRLKNNAATLTSSAETITRGSIDERINRVLSKFQQQGGNPMPSDNGFLDLRVHEVSTIPGTRQQSYKQPLIYEEYGCPVTIASSTRLLPGCNTVVEVRSAYQSGQNLPKGDIILLTDKNNAYLNKKKVLVLPGCYQQHGESFKALVTNLSTEEVKIPAGLSIGSIHATQEQINTGIHSLDHRPAQELNKKEVAERRTFIKESLKLDTNPHLTERQDLKERVIAMFLRYWDALAISDSDYGKTNVMKFQIQLKPGSRPVAQKVRPLNPMQEKDLQRQIKDWTDAGIIEPSMSPWASALVPCKKKNSDKLRWAIDYRAVNEMTIKDRFPLGNIESNLHKLSGSNIFSCLDSAGAFHSLVVDEPSRDYTSFITPMGQYRFTRLPFGLCNAPSQYSRLVQMALDRMPPGFALAYVDDIILHSQNLEEHLSHLEQCVSIHAQFGMRLNPAKCHIFQDEVEYLGHLVSSKGIRMIPSYVDRILEWPLPNTPKELRSFLGFSGYYRAFIKDYSFLTAELNKMKTQKKLEWTEEVKTKFKQLKESFRTGPTRGYPKYEGSGPFILDTDFSAVNKAAVLSQIQDGREVFLGCAAQKCNKAEATYPSHKGEMAALVLGLKKFEHILRAKPFRVRTDSQCVKHLQTMKEYRGIWARWYQYVASFDFVTEHRKGSLQTNADALSRVQGFQEQLEEEPESTEDMLQGVEDVYAVEQSQNQQATDLTCDEIPEMTIRDLKRAQKEDFVLKQIIPFVQQGTAPEANDRKGLTADGMVYAGVFECLVLDKCGILRYQAPAINGVRKPPRICVPNHLQPRIFEILHAHPTSGHYGINTTFQKAKEKFYWPRMYIDIQARVRNCVPCIVKDPTMGKEKHIHHREVLSYFGQRVYVDTIGPLTAKRYRGENCQHILTIQDGYTRYLMAIPVPNITAQKVAETLVSNWVYVHGCPEYIHTDRGSSFTSEVFESVMKALGICKTVTPAYSPQGDRVERAHRVIGNILRADHRYDPGSWAEKLPVAVFAYNSTVNRYLGISPFEAVFGRVPTMPIDLIFPLPRPDGQTWANYVLNLRRRFQNLFEQVCRTQRTNITIDQGRVQGRSKSTIKVGDLVYYFMNRIKRGLSKKLQNRWIGPFVVKRRPTDSLAVIYPHGSWAKNPREIATIVSRLKVVDPQFLRTDEIHRPTQPMDIEACYDGDEEMEEPINYPEEEPGLGAPQLLHQPVPLQGQGAEGAVQHPLGMGNDGGQHFPGVPAGPMLPMYQGPEQEGPGLGWPGVKQEVPDQIYEEGPAEPNPPQGAITRARQRLENIPLNPLLEPPKRGKTKKQN